MRKPHILWVGGGSGGHITPLLAVLEEVHRLARANSQQVRHSYVGLEQDVSSPLLQEYDYLHRYPITMGKLHRQLTLDHFRQLVRVVKGMDQANRLIKELRPDLVFAKGAFVSVPIVRAARAHGIPVFSHESDVMPGLANRYISTIAERIFTAYPISAYKKLPVAKLREVGQPVRKVFYEPAGKAKVRGKAIPTTIPMLMVIGGSQGARRINQLISESWDVLLGAMSIVHITGPLEYDLYERKRAALPDEQQKRLFVVPFLSDEFPDCLKRADVVVSRAGGSIAELAATGKASILLPLSTAAQNHQWENAMVVRAQEAARVFDERVVQSSELASAIQDILHDAGARKRLQENIREFDHPEAAKEMAQEVLARIGVL